MSTLPPQNLEAESALLGAMIMDNDIIPEVRLNSGEFYSAANMRIYAAVQELDAKGTPVDIVTLIESLTTSRQLEHIGGQEYLARIASEAVTTVNHKAHAEIIRDKAMRRHVLTICRDVAGDVHEAPLEELQERLYIQLDHGEIRHRHIKEVAMRVSEQTQKRYDLNKGNKDAIYGIPSGFHALDVITDGFQKKQFYILGGRPGMGKSAFMGQAVAYAGRSHHAHVNNLEMDDERQVARMVMDQGGIKSWQIRKAMMNSQEWTDFASTLGDLSALNITFDDKSANINDLRQSIVMAARAGADLVGVDYLQMVQNSGAKTREREVGEVGTMLKHLTKSLDIAILALASLNRGVEARESKRPLLSDLRESGQLESDADVIMFLYRDDYYKRKSETHDGIAELIIAKGRDIGESTIKLRWDDQRARFRPFEED